MSDKSCTIITINHPSANEFDCKIHCDAETAIKGASLIISQVLEITPNDLHPLIWDMLKQCAENHITINELRKR